MNGSRLQRLAGLARIREFVGRYRVDDGRRQLEPAERVLIEDALVDYLLNEEWAISEARARTATARHALALMATQLPAIARPTLTLVDQIIADLAERVEHREEANLIMREHLIVLSETIRQLKLRMTQADLHPTEGN